jgi:hypothetical protein
MMFELMSRKGAWWTFNDTLINELKDAGIKVNNQYQGEKAVYDLLENDSTLVKFLVEKFRKILIN